MNNGANVSMQTETYGSPSFLLAGLGKVFPEAAAKVSPPVSNRVCPQA